MASLEGDNLVIFAYEIWSDKRVVDLVVVALEEGDYCTYMYHGWLCIHVATHLFV